MTEMQDQKLQETKDWEDKRTEAGRADMEQSSETIPH